MKKVIIATAFAAAMMSSAAHATTIGVAMAQFNDNFLTVLRNGMIDYAKTLPNVTLQVESRPGMKMTVAYDGPIKAPIAKGQRIGTLKVTAPEFPTLNVPLYAANAVDRAGIFGRMFLGIRHMITGH